jgi:uncharacterized membrane protein YhaH (DUF805 family)
MVDGSTQSYYLDASRIQQGPVSVNDLARLIRGGAITRDTMIWFAGMADWRPAGQVNEFASLFGGPPGPPSARPPMPPAGAMASYDPQPVAPGYSSGGYASAAYAGKSVGFGEAVSTCFRKYADFDGRASRPEFWFWQLFVFLTILAVSIIGLIIAAIIPNVGIGVLLVGCIIAALAFFLPGLAVTVRRLHDSDKSGWFILLTFIPFLAIGTICLIVFGCLPGTPGHNRFGPQP